MYCQVCGARNGEEQEYCRHCHQKLMVVSGPQAIEEQETFDAHPEEQFSFDEHLLERISILEEVVKRTTESLRQALGTIYKLEQQILVNQTGMTTLRDLLERGWQPRELRYMLLSIHYRKVLDLTEEALAAARQNLARLDDFADRLARDPSAGPGDPPTAAAVAALPVLLDRGGADPAEDVELWPLTQTALHLGEAGEGGEE